MVKYILANQIFSKRHMKKYDKSVVHGVREAEYLRKFDEYRLVETVDSHYGK